ERKDARTQFAPDRLRGHRQACVLAAPLQVFLLLRRKIWILTGSVVRGIHNLSYLRYELSYQALNALPQRDVRGSAALATASHSNEDVVVLSIEQLYKATAHSDTRIDVRDEHLLHSPPDLLRR